MSEGHPSDSIGARRIALADSLVDPHGAPKGVVAAENSRVTQLMAESYANPYEGWSKMREYGHRMLAAVGIVEPKKPQVIERPWLARSQASREEHIKSLLDESRERLRAGTVFGVDDIEVDAYLGLRAEENQSILPPIFRRWHAKAEEASGRQLSFLEWMTDHATDEQLLNVWQWHDSYLQRLDSEPRFQEMVAKVKRDYVRGVKRAVKDGRLDPAVLESLNALGGLDGVTITHASPFTAYTATTRARVDRENRRVTVSGAVDEKHLFHELTHVLQGGFLSLLNEGYTELVTAEIYNHAQRKKAKYDLEHSVYKDQIALCRILERLTHGVLDIREMSRIGTGDNPAVNSVRATLAVDERLGMPLFLYAVKDANEVQAAAAAKYTGIDALYGASRLLRNCMEVIEDAYVDERGRRLQHNAKSLLNTLLSDRILNKHDPIAIEAAIRSLVLADKDPDGLKIGWGRTAGAEAGVSVG